VLAVCSTSLRVSALRCRACLTLHHQACSPTCGHSLSPPPPLLLLLPSGPSKGLFTTTNPELRRVVPDDVAGRVKVKVVYTGA
jgi:hypothetical protein